VAAADAYRGRVFGAFSTVMGSATLVGIALSGVLGDTIGLVPVLMASAVVRVVAGGVALAFLPRQVAPPGATLD
jgi:hypothetical protein